MFFWQTRPCLHLVVNPLYLPSWSLLLILDFNSETSTSRTVSFTFLDVMKGVFFTMERILRSFPTVVLRGRPCVHFYVAELGALFFFFRTVDLATSNVPAISLMDLFCFLKPNNCLFHLYGELLWPHDVGSQQQLPNANGTLKGMKNERIAHFYPWNGFWVNCPITYKPIFIIWL